MTLLLFGLLFLAGSINAATNVTRNAGDSYGFTILAFGSDIASCHLRTLHDGTLDFLHEQPSPHERYELLPSDGVFPSCTINVPMLTVNDTGEWEVSYTSSSGDTKSEVTRLTVIGPEPKWLNHIDYPTAIGNYIDISLSKIDQKEECILTKDDEEVEEGVDGVQVKKPSEFVSCRVTIGPMTESLLGNWTLCGSHTIDGREEIRCQLVLAYWYNEEKPNTDLDTTIIGNVYRHPVHLGGSLSPAVVGVGNEIVTCHVVTPNGEDLVIDEDSEYPNLRLLPSSTKESPICSVEISPIQTHMIGEWNLYGRFRSLVLGIHEVHFPFTMFLYDEENPYNQAYNVSVLDPIVRSASIGSSVTLGVSGKGDVNSCEVTTPSGQSYDLTNIIPSFIVTVGGCRFNVGPVAEDLFGNWSLIGKFNNNGHFTELRSIVNLVEEDPANPIEEDRNVEELDRQRIVTKLGDLEKIVIPSETFINGESCHIITNTGEKYDLLKDSVPGFPGVSVVDEPDVECGIEIDVHSTSALGEWTLIAKAKRHSEKIERRLPFTITVEEFVEASPREIEVLEGRTVNVRLSESTILYKTCRLRGPNFTVYMIDQNNVETCSFSVLNVRTSQQGTWEITYYGETITYRAPITVTVLEKPITVPVETTDSIEVMEGTMVKAEVGSENAVYCQLYDPWGHTVFNDFGRCHLSIERVDYQRHNGHWRMLVGYAGNILPVQESLFVNVTHRVTEPETEVSVVVTKNRPNVTMSCSLPSSGYQVEACKFRNPEGGVMLVTGDDEERDIVNGDIVRYNSELSENTCSLTIVNPQWRDVGRWRCAMQTKENVHYGFPFAYCPWVVQNIVTSDAGEVPVLRTQQDVFIAQGQSATMACAVNAAIRYCYFRSQNGTVINVHPDLRTSSMEYVGSGFNAGECGIRFSDLQPSDSGTWWCHAALRGVGDHMEEQRDRITVMVDERMTVSHFREMNSRTVVVNAIVHTGQPLEYCRFVRVDGLGFTTDNVPPEYFSSGSIWNGYCEIRIPNPTRLDLHPWTIVAKIPGEPEISRTTNTSLNALNNGHNGSSSSSAMLIFLYVLLAVAFVTLILGAAPKRSRRWVNQRYNQVRHSFRKPPAASTTAAAATTAATPAVPDAAPPQYTP